jgi:hypothetical protein
MPEAGAPTVSFATVYSTAIMGTCTECHKAGATAAGGLDMSTEAAAFTNLTTGAPSGADKACATTAYVVKGSAATSLLYQKVSGTGLPATGCGVKMPKGVANYAAANVTLIENWINGGAAM